jgi:predicted small lipoprotein YifL
MHRRLILVSVVCATALALSACGRAGDLEPPPGREKQATPLSKPPERAKAVLKPVAEPLLPYEPIAPAAPTPENTKPKPAKPQRSFFLDPLL